MIEKFICPICSKELKNLNVYNSHLTWHENVEKFPNVENDRLFRLDDKFVTVSDTLVIELTNDAAVFVTVLKACV